MGVQREISGRADLDRIAEEHGVAVVVVDRSSIEISASNNNSICSSLNPDGELVGACAANCGKALDDSTDAGGAISYTCHAGLECRAEAMTLDGKPVATIVGRTFVKAENYRRATERAISGDWQSYPPSEFFENVLLAGSDETLDRAIAAVEAASVSTDDSAVIAATSDVEKISRLAESIERKAAEAPPVPDPSGQAAADAAVWRSFFHSLLEKSYIQAAEAMLGFLAEQHGFASLVWLERSAGRLSAVTAYGPLKGRRLRLGLSANDPRLAEAAANEVPLELSERGDEADKRTMYLFPVPVGGEVPSALAVLEPIVDPAVGRRISRLCQSIGPRLEILRLRGEVRRRELLASGVRRFSDGLKQADADDFWLQITQIATELMQAERGSLLVLDEEASRLEIKAAIGARSDLSRDTSPGSRVSRVVLERGKAAVVADVAKTGLPPFPPERGYKTSSFLSAPIPLGERNIAVINFTDKVGGGTFDRTDLEMLQEIAPQIAVAIDRALLKERAGEFEQLSVTDALTGLLNRRYLEERLFEEVKRSNRHGYPMSYIELDVDLFKSYNDEFGHPGGDVALKLVAQVMRDTLRGADVAARVGGEEFAILLPQTTNTEAVAIAERLRANVEATQFPGRKVTISVGVASCSSELCTTDGIVHAADKALYRAKNSGRNVVQNYDEQGPENQ